jgi:hypothetical protein
LDAHWNDVAQVAHFSYAHLCDGPNKSMTRAGIPVGYNLEAATKLPLPDLGQLTAAIFPVARFIDLG